MPIFTLFNQLNPKPMKIELRKLSINTRLSEETICFSADIFIDGIKCGTASNRGYGGSTDYDHLNTDSSKMLIKNAEKFCAAMPPIDLGMNGRTMPMSLEHYIDELVYAEDSKKEIKKFEAKTAKDCLKYICYGIRGKQYRKFGWTGLTIEQVLKHAQGRGAMIKAIENIKAKLGKNEEILNTNLGDLLK